MNDLDNIQIISQTIFDKKGMNILALDVRKLSSMTDFFIIAEGTVDRHVQAIGQAIEEKLSKQGVEPLHVEGGTGEWMVLDYGDIVIHIFTSALRERYSLENLWKEGKIVNVNISKTDIRSSND